MDDELAREIAEVFPDLPAGALAPLPTGVPWWVPALAGLGLALLGLVFLGRARLRRAVPATQVGAAVAEPRQEAIHALRAAAKGGREAGGERLMARRISDALKRFMAREYGLAVQGRTTDETLMLMTGETSPGLPAEFVMRISRLLEACDDVKFRAEGALREGIEAAREEAERLIREAPGRAVKGA